MIARANCARPLPFRSGIAQSCITSPPYTGRRKYGNSPDEIGLEAFHEYCRNLTIVGDQVADILVPTGTWWLNIGDFAAGSGGAGGDYNEGGSKEGQLKYRQGRPTIGLPTRETQSDLFGGASLDGWTHEHTRLPPGNWGLAPFHVAAHLQGAGWIVRKEIVWDKNDTKPEDPSHTRRPGESHETLFMLTRSMDYKFNADAIPKRRLETAAEIAAQPRGTAARLARGDRAYRIKGSDDRWYGAGRDGSAKVDTSEAIAAVGGIVLCINDSGSVWHIDAGRSESGDHPAPMPNAVAERCILLSTDPGDVVVDPFTGSGTTIDAAERLGRVGFGTDLYAA